MRADYDSTANAISIAFTDARHADKGDEVHSRAIVALADGKPVEVQLLYPDMGISEPLAAVADRYELDLEAPRRRAIRARSPRPGRRTQSRGASARLETQRCMAGSRDLRRLHSPTRSLA
jgi:hypothetical protein